MSATGYVPMPADLNLLLRKPDVRAALRELIADPDTASGVLKEPDELLRAATPIRPGGDR